MIKLCDRCKKYIEGFEDETGMTVGYYKRSGWSKYMNANEDIVCDECMFLDDRYIEVYGVHSKYLILINKLAEYIEFLSKANEGPINIAWVHGWRCPTEDIEKGEKLRKEIESLKKLI